MAIKPQPRQKGPQNSKTKLSKGELEHLESVGSQARIRDLSPGNRSENSVESEAARNYVDQLVNRGSRPDL
jgi:hypothetical protein